MKLATTALFAVAILLALAPASSAAVSCSASVDRSTARVGEQLVLTLVVQGDARDVEDPQLPEMGPFGVASGGRSQSFQFVNGAVSATFTYTYYLRPQRAGSFVLPSIPVTAGGIQMRTGEIPVKILAKGAALPTPKGEPNAGGTGGQPGDDYFVQMQVDKKRAVVGEQVVLTFSFFRGTRSSLFDSPQYTPPSTEGFLREDLPPEKHTSMVLRGRRYDVTQIQYALFPTREGTLRIGEATVKIPEDSFPSVFRRRRKTRGDVELRAPAVQVHVEALPPGAPAGFEGTVGERLRLRSHVDRSELKVGEALTMTLSLEGTGYIKGAAAPAVPELPDFRVHDSGTSADTRPAGGKLVGNLTIERLMIPLVEGARSLPSVQYVYYDTAKNEYVRLQTPPVKLNILPSDAPQTTSFATGSRNPIELLGGDILHIQAITGALRPYSGPLMGRAAFWGLLAAPALLWAASGVLARRYRKRRADPQGRRASAALRVARERLARGGDAEDVASAVRGYVADKSGRSAAGLTQETIAQWLQRSGASPEAAKSILELLDRCDRQRFAPGSDDGFGLAEEARELLQRLHGEVAGA